MVNVIKNKYEKIKSKIKTQSGLKQNFYQGKDAQNNGQQVKN